MRRTRRRKIKERRASFVLALCALALVPVAAHAADPVHPSTKPVTAAPAPVAGVVVGLSLGDPAMQAGVLRNGEVVLARGFEIELARIVSRRLRIPVDRFVELRPLARLPAASPMGWSMALGSIESNRGIRPGSDLTIPYLPTDAVLVLRRGLSKPRSLADLRDRVLCAVRGGGVADAIPRSVRPRHKPLLAADDDGLLTLVRTGACDAAVVPGVEAGRFVRGHRAQLGPLGGRIHDGNGLSIAVSRQTGPPVSSVDRVLRRLRSDGTLGRLARSWLGLDPASLRALG